MEPISVFDMLKIGIGPSSSHTLGPWRAAQRFTLELEQAELLQHVDQINIKLYGSLALTGKGHGTDIAILLGLSGEDPVTIHPDAVHTIPQQIQAQRLLVLNGNHSIPFSIEKDMEFHFEICLPFHANGMEFNALSQGNSLLKSTYYSIGGGFVVKEGEKNNGHFQVLPHPIDTGDHLINHCVLMNHTIAEIVLKNELAWRTPTEVRVGVLEIWEVMKQCLFKGCHTEGVLPGGLHVNRRAAGIHQKLIGSNSYNNADEWIQVIKDGHYNFSTIVKWIGCFAMAVNEENASFGKVVTAPTNGAAGVIPAVLMYYICFSGVEVEEQDIINFLFVASEIGSLFKKGATISAAMGGCQAEIGVSSAMAAAALTEALGGKPDQALMAAEIAMEHHLGLTCDPIGGLVQVPCIERNSMGAVKAITAANIALESDPSKACVTLDGVIQTMWETAKDMNTKYKETSLGGLAAHISIRIPEC